MKFKSFILAILFFIVFCFSSINTSRATEVLDPWGGHHVTFTISSGHWVITVYDSNGGIIRVITLPIH